MSASLKDLLAQREALEKQIAEARNTERAEAISKVRELMAQFGLTAADLNSRSAARTGRTLGKVAAKYRDTSTGQTWSGRGLQPRWLREALAAGKKLTDFAV
jgi:DNA-binding protein H-NS